MFEQDTIAIVLIVFLYTYDFVLTEKIMNNLFENNDPMLVNARHHRTIFQIEDLVFGIDREYNFVSQQQLLLLLYLESSMEDQYFVQQ